MVRKLIEAFYFKLEISFLLVKIALCWFEYILTFVYSDAVTVVLYNMMKTFNDMDSIPTAEVQNISYCHLTVFTLYIYIDLCKMTIKSNSEYPVNKIYRYAF